MAKTGRNDPCHCGSGKKYKRGCLEKDDAASAAAAQAKQAASASRTNALLDDLEAWLDPYDGLDDIVGTRGASVRCVECKSSATAPLTPGQTAAHPQIETQGATVMGRGKPSVPGGTHIPPTSVEIRRPE